MARGDDRLLLMHGLGSGKSLASIAAAQSEIGPTVVGLPASLRNNFQNEWSKYTTNTPDPEIKSYTSLAKSPAVTKQPTTVIYDEAQRLRNPQSAQTLAAVDLANKSRRLLLLSGTPIVNDPTDLAPLLGMLTRRSIPKERFAERYIGSKSVHPGLMGWLQGAKPVSVPTLQREDELSGLLRNHVDYHPSELPSGVEVTDRTIDVDLSPTQANLNQEFWKRTPALLRWKLRNDFPLSNSEVQRLTAFMTGPRQAGLSPNFGSVSSDPLKSFDHSGKLQAAFGSLQKHLGSNNRSKALIFSNFVGAGINPYAAALARDKVPHEVFHGGMSEQARREALNRYNTGASRVMLLSPAGAEGISTKGTNLIQVLDRHWNESRGQQAVGRGLRFDSHTGLPEDLKNVAVERYVAHSPRPSWLSRAFGGKPTPTADEILGAQAARKEQLNEQFREVLRRVGSEGRT